MADITPPPDQDPGIDNFNFQDIQTPWATTWWNTQWITQIPEQSLGWLLAQGWQITSIDYDQTKQPPIPYYALTKDVMNNTLVLQSMLNRYTVAYNDARFANQERYNEVVQSWTTLFEGTQDYHEDEVDQQNAHCALFLGNLETYMNEVDSLIDANQTQLQIDASSATTALDELNAKLDDLETNADANATIIEGLLTDQASYLSSFLTDLDAKLAELDTNYTAHLASMTTLLGNSDTDLATFASEQSTQLSAISSAYSSLVTDIDALLTEADGYLTTVGTDVEAVLTATAADYSTLDSDVGSRITSSSSALGSFDTDYQATLDLIESDYTAIATELNAEITASNAALAAHKTAYGAEVDSLETNYDSHVSTATGFLTGLGTTELARINEAFAASLSDQLQQLTDRGLYSAAVAADITERNTRDRDEEIAALNDRLNREKWENQHRLFEQQSSMQDKTLQGKDRLHGVEQELISAHFAQITSRYGLQQDAHNRTLTGTSQIHSTKQAVYQYQATQLASLYQLLQATRDRTLNAKTTLYSLRDANNRLNIQVETQMYESGQAIKQRLIEEAARLQQLEQAVTQWQAGTRDTLLNQIQQIELQQADGIKTLHDAQQAVSRVAMEARDRLLAQLQDAVNGLLTGKERYSSMTMQNASTLAEHKHRAVAEKMSEFAARLEGQRGVHADNMKLMSYMLSERNQLMIGLYGFAERREDIGPGFNELTQIAAQLADSGGGWIAP